MLMNLFRLIILALAIWIAFRIWQNYRSKAKNRPTKPTTQHAISDMVSCDVCNMHIPEHEALQKDNKYYCSQQHLDRDN